MTEMTDSPCLAQIQQLRKAQNKTLEMYRDLYESYIESPYKSYDRSRYKDPTLNLSSYFADETANISSLVEQDSTASTIDISRVKSNNTTVSEMWSNFNVDTYAPRERPKPKAKMAKKFTPVQKLTLTKPDPFYMTLRDELKVPTKTRAQEEVEEARRAKREEEERECIKKFKASPIPQSTFGSRLKKIQDKQEARRSTVKAMSKEITLANQKPFSFTKREGLRRSRSLSSLDTEAKKRKESEKVQFSAKPMPRHIFDPQVGEKQKEEEEYRQIRMKMRAEQMLADSSLPQNMRRHALHYTDGRIRRAIAEDNEKRAHMTEEHTFSPAIKDYVPDYELLHQQNEAELLARQAVKPVTTVEPFNLRTEQLARDKAMRTPPSSPVPSPTVRKSPCLYTQAYGDHCNAKPTIASNLRDSANRKKIIAEKKVRAVEYEVEINNKLKELSLRKSVVLKSKALDPTYRTSIDTKVKEKIEEQKLKEIQYQAQLEAMQDKLRDRPFLFERQASSTARQSTEKSFRRALEAAGIDEDLIKDISKFEQDSLMIS